MNITPMTNVFDAAVIGGGAAGLMAAGCCGENGVKTVLIEKNAQPGRKLSITGKGRCNVTNDCSVAEFLENVPTNPKFLYAAINAFSPRDTMEFFESVGVALKTERGRRVFPVSDKAADITNSLVSYCRRGGVKMLKGAVTAIEKRDGMFFIEICGTGAVMARSVIVCTGGMTYQSTGSTGDGYKFAKSFGHTVTPLTPSLVPLVSPDALCKECMGLTLSNVRVSFEKNKKTLYAETGDMLFTHFGISGPAVLSASSHLSAFPVTACIDLKIALDAQTLDRRILRDFSTRLNRDFGNSLSALLPQKLIASFIGLTGIDAHKKVNSITKQERALIVSLLKRLPVSITGKRPMAEGIITSGGVKCSEIDPKTMCSRLVPDLYFAGEVLDVDAYTGGYNLQIAFSTARAAAHAIISRINSI